jgi:sulfur-oxidizing protein SoxZ
MAEHVRPRVKAPATAKKGEVMEIKTLISHRMESGQRKGKDGKLIPREIINTFTCTYNGKTVFKAKLEPAISANPFFSFFVKATGSGTLDFAWVDDDGSVYKAQRKITVS